MAALGRQPTRSETQQFQVLWKQHHKGKASDALQDMFWALLNSNEFVMNR
jgi:hypothetical protein